MSKYKIDDVYSDDDGVIERKYVCRHCEEQCDSQEKPFKVSYLQYSFGYPAGQYCEECWLKSGYRDATDPDAKFDEGYAGESLHGEGD